MIQQNVTITIFLDSDFKLQIMFSPKSKLPALPLIAEKIRSERVKRDQWNLGI